MYTTPNWPGADTPGLSCAAGRRTVVRLSYGGDKLVAIRNVDWPGEDAPGLSYAP